MHSYSPALSSVPEIHISNVFLTLSLGCSKGIANKTLKRNSCSLSQNLIFPCSGSLWMVLPTHSGMQAANLGRGHFRLFYCPHPIHHQVFMFASCILLILSSYSRDFSPHRDHKFSGFDSCWSTHIHFGLLPPLSTEQPKRYFKMQRSAMACLLVLG